VQAAIGQASDEANRFRETGGKAGTRGDPALRAADHFWSYRMQHPGTAASVQATRAAFHLLQIANQDEVVIRRAERLPSNDPSWDTVISDMRASARKTGCPERLILESHRLLREVKDSGIRAAILLHQGRAYIDLQRPQSAEIAFRAAASEAPGSAAAKAAERFLYDLTSLGVGQLAPSFESTTIEGALIRSPDLKGNVVLLNFWATW
jgi:hypothetical protein